MFEVTVGLLHTNKKIDSEDNEKILQTLTKTLETYDQYETLNLNTECNLALAVSLFN